MILPIVFRILFLVGLLVCTSPLLAQEAATRLLKAFEDAVDRGQVLGAQIETGNAREAVTSNCLGHVDGSRKSKVTEGTLFGVCSVTKPIVATAAVRLSESKKLDLDSPVEEWLDGLLPKTTKVGEQVRRSPTVRECLGHRSGVYSNADFFQKESDPQVKMEMIRSVRDLSWSLEECVERICERPFSAQPGTDDGYSCAGFFLAGRCLELSAKRPIDEIVEQEIVGPLDMKHTTFFPKSSGNPIAVPGPTQIQAIRSFFGSTGNRTWQDQAHDFDGRPKLASPSMGLYSTATDLGQVARLMLNRGRIDDQKFISEESWKEMTSNQADDSIYGLGWGLHIEDDVVTALSHNGSGRGCKCHIHIDLKSKTYLVAVYTLLTVEDKVSPGCIRLALTGRRSLGVGFDPKRTDEGLFVKSLARTFPAQNAGIRFGDRIVKMDGEAITSVEECDKAVEEADHDLNVEVLRAGERLTFEVRFDE